MTSANDGNLFVFSEERNQTTDRQIHPWKILCVDDDLNYQRSLLFALAGFQVREKAIEILTANSAASAAVVLTENPDISVILLDVVMEEDDSGLKLVNSIRNMLGNSTVRIVLLTGQPGMAPQTEVMKRYDIDEYWNKSELTSELLQSVLSSHIRTWDSMIQLEQARQGLQLIIDSSRTLSNKREINTFTHSVLDEISSIIGIKDGGLIIAINNLHKGIDDAKILASTGKYQKYASTTLASLPQDEIRSLAFDAVQHKTHQFHENFSVLFFDFTEMNAQAYIVIVQSAEPLSDAHINLLQAFSENIRSGFTNVQLLNRLTQLAYFDPTLEIHNRNWLLHEINSMSAIERAATRLLLIEVGQYHEINFTFGDHFSDQLLKNLHARLTEKLPKCQVIARVKPNTFGLFIDAESNDHRLIQKLNRERLQFETTDHYIDFIIADIPLAKMDTYQAEQIMRLSESTLSIAKRQNIDYILYSHDIAIGVRERFKLLQELKQAIKEEQLFIMLQPKVELETGYCVGFEALVRWQKSDGTFVPPNVFIPLAETSRLITQIDFEVFRQTLEAIKTLQASGFYLPISFNATCRDLQDSWYMHILLDTLKKSGIDPKYLEMEITESQAMENYQLIQPQLKSILDKGMKITIDDFGTGYSSLAHINNIVATGFKPSFRS